MAEAEGPLPPMRFTNKLRPMGTGTFVQEFKDGLEFTPVQGQSNLFVIHLRRAPAQPAQEEMTSEDWDEFERHIEDAFEQVP
jgi:hypothetical protein